MTTDLEKQFFDTFGIEPIAYCEHGCNATNLSTKCKDCIFVDELKYPQITDRILLELICIVSERRILPNCDVNGLKEYVLKELCTMIMSEKAKQQVQALFKE